MPDHDLRLRAHEQKILFPGIHTPSPPPRECLPFQVLNKDSTTRVWSLHAPFSLVLHTLHQLEKYKQHGSVLRLRTDSLHKHFYNLSWLIHCQHLVSVGIGEVGWRQGVGSGKLQHQKRTSAVPSMTEWRMPHSIAGKELGWSTSK